MFHAPLIALLLAINPQQNGSTAFQPQGPSVSVPFTTPGAFFEEDANTVLHWAPETWNMVRFPEAFDNAAWAKGTRVTVTPDVIAAPFGGLTADKIIETATTQPHNQTQTVTAVVNTPYSFSVYAKAGERSWSYLQIAGAYQFFNLTTCTASGDTTGLTYATASSVGAGWCRIVINMLPIGSPLVITVGIAQDGLNAHASYLGDGTSGAYFWGASLTRTLSPLPYFAPSSTGDTFVMNGSVPYSFTSPLFDGGIETGRRGVGPFAAGNYFSQAIGGALQFPGAFTVCAAFTLTDVSTAYGVVSTFDGSNGWILRVGSGTYFQVGGGGVPSSVPATVGRINIVCGGYSPGPVEYIKVNGGPTGTGNATQFYPTTMASTIGRIPLTGTWALPGIIYEVWATSTPWNEASISAIQASALANGDPNVPFFPNDANTVLHLIGNAYNGTTWAGPFGAMTTNGAVSFSDAFVPNPGLVRAGAGPFSGANYYSLGTGSDVLDFTGDFTACFVYTGNVAMNDGILAEDSDGTSGYYIDSRLGRVGLGPSITFFSGGVGTTVGGALVSQEPPGAANILCVGRAGATGYLKVNGLTTSSGPAGTIAAATAAVARLGLNFNNAASFNDQLHEAWFSTTPASDALFTKIQNRFLNHLTADNTPLTVTRSKTQTYVVPAASGQTLWTAPDNVLASGANGVEIFGAATNYALQSETSCVVNAVQAPWALVGAPTCVTDAAVAPDGLAEMDAWTNTASSDGITQPLTTSSAAIFTTSTWASKAALGTVTGTFVCTAPSAATASCTCGTSDGSACTCATAGTTATAKFTAVGPTSPRLWYTTTCTVPLTNPVINWYPGELGVSTGVASFYGAQVEVLSLPTPYIPTVAAAVVRSATAATAPIPTLSDTNNWCMGITATPGLGWTWTTAPTSQLDPFGFGVAGAANSTRVFFTGANIAFQFWDSAAAVASFGPAAHGLTGSTPARIIIQNNVGTLTMYLNGVLKTTITTGGTRLWSATPANVDIGRINNSGGIEHFSGALANLKIKVNPNSWKDCQ